MPTISSPPQLGRVAEAAERVSVSRYSIYRLIQRGELTAYRVGSTSALRVDLAEVDALLRPVGGDRK